MAVQGYLTHAAQNRRRTIWLVLLYVLGFEVLGAFASAMILLRFDEEHTVLSDPLGYLLRYGLPVAILAGVIFWRLYRGHSRSVAERLGIRPVTREDERRFVDIAEAQCIALGVRVPRFGVLEASELNALAIGDGPRTGMIAVTRGLLDGLDDDELAAVCAHEASLIRLGDTRLLAANHALMRTAVILQTQNPLRLEDMRQLIVAVLIPPMFLLLVVSSAATMASLQLARWARRGLKLGRDHIADGEAVRVTHYPEALIGAIRKIEGRGAFSGSHVVAGLLFVSPADADGRRATAASRTQAIASLGREMMSPTRSRRDTRPEAVPRSAMRQLRAIAGRSAGRFARDAEGRPLAQPPRPTLRMLWLRVSDPEAYRDWRDACIDWWEWRVSDGRNMLGLKPKMAAAVIATAALLVVVHRPADGDLRSYARIFDPASIVELVHRTHGYFGCQGATAGPNACGRPDEPALSAPALAGGFAVPERVTAGTPQSPVSPSLPPNILPALLFGLVFLRLRRPGLLRRLFGRE